VADHEFDSVAGKVVGDGNALLGIGNVVAKADSQFLTENAAGGIDVCHGLFDAILHLRARSGIRSSDRTSDAKFDLGGRGTSKCAREAQRQAERSDPLHCQFPSQ
jgi:hypothetical protein